MLLSQLKDNSIQLIRGDNYFNTITLRRLKKKLCKAAKVNEKKMFVAFVEQRPRNKKKTERMRCKIAFFWNFCVRTKDKSNFNDDMWNCSLEVVPNMLVNWFLGDFGYFSDTSRSFRGKWRCSSWKSNNSLFFNRSTMISTKILQLCWMFHKMNVP